MPRLGEDGFESLGLLIPEERAINQVSKMIGQ
jgi:hypothetical protein